MISLDDTVAIIESKLLVLEEVIRIVKVHRGAPSFLLLILMAGGSGIMCDENAFLRQALDTLLIGIRSDTPGEIVNVLFHELPLLPEILGHIQFFVYLAWVPIAELLAIGPCGSEGPVFFEGVELELMNLFTGV